MRWEYRITAVSMTMLNGPRKDALPEMNRLGDECWELVAACPHIDANGHVSEMTLFWKRPKSEGAE